jgi:hypothetical protein
VNRRVPADPSAVEPEPDDGWAGRGFTIPYTEIEAEPEPEAGL